MSTIKRKIFFDRKVIPYKVIIGSNPPFEKRNNKWVSTKDPNIVVKEVILKDAIKKRMKTNES